jgi:VWFA-related protein
MTRLSCSVLATVLGFGLSALPAAAQTAAAQGAPPQTPASQAPAAVFRAGADVVPVEASVRRDRRVVSGLQAGDFELLDNGVPQQITEVAYEKLPIDVTVLLDVSASVTGPVLDDLRRALHQLRTDLRPSDRMRLIAFNMGLRRLVDFDEPAAAIDAALASAQGTGSSAVFDSLAVALASPAPSGRRHLVVLFTDGRDSSSILDAEALLDVARHTTPTVAVILGSRSVNSQASLLRTSSPLGGATVGAVSERIAGETGGFVTTVDPGEDLTSRFRRVLEEFRSSYVLYFTPTGVDRAGSHTLDVRVNRPGVTVRARRGYVWQ